MTMTTERGRINQRDVPLLRVSGLTKRFAGEPAIEGAAFLLCPVKSSALSGRMGPAKLL